jgi:hypothetical protein
MDKRLLDALNNLSEALQEIAETLKTKGGEKKSPTTTALQSGNFGNDLKSISDGIKSIKKDTQAILNKQNTISSISKEKDDEKKSFFEKAGGDKKSESNLKKGVGAILLIALAVLAIGLAFKIVGGVNFLSVIGISIAILILAEAFQKIGALRLTLKEAAVTAAALVLMSIAVTASSWILKKITPIGFAQSITMIMIGVGFSLLSPAIGKIISSFSGMSWGQVLKAAVGLVMVLPAIALGITLSSWILNKINPIGFTQSLTMILIGVGFSVLSPAIGSIIKAFSGMSWGQVIKSVAGLVLVLPAIALGITISSWILKKITPIGFTQALSAIFIAAMFTVVSYGINKLLKALGGNSIGTMLKAIVFLPLILPAIALGIVLSSYVLKKTQPIGLPQAWGAIMVAFIFTVISFGLKNIIQAMGKVNMKSVLMIPIILPLISLAIVLSSKFLSMVQPITFIQFLTSIAIALVFVVIGFAVKIIGRALDGMRWSSIIKMPALFTLVSLAIMLSSHILAKTKAPSIAETLKIALFGIALGIIIAVMMIPFVIISKFKIGITDIVKGTIAIIAIATAIMVSSHIVGMGQYTKYPSIAWSLGTGAAILTFGLAVLGLGMAIALTAGVGLAAIALGAVAVVIVAGSIAASSHIVAKGRYTNYPGIAWALSVGGLMVAFGASMILLGVMPKLVIRDGAWAIKEVAKSIVTADREVRKGKYDKFPSLAWSLSVSALMIGYSIGIAALGILPKFVIKDGVWALKEVAKSIVTTDREVRKGKYDKFPGIAWSVTVSALMLGYAAGMAALGILPKMIVRDGIWALKNVAKSILTTDRIVSRGKYKNFPGIAWSVTVSALMLGYAVGMAALGVLPKMIVRDGTWALKSVAKSILTTDRIVSRGNYKNFPSVPWATTVGLLMTAWSVGVSVLGLLPKFIIKDGTWAVKQVAKSIVSTGYIFAKSSGVFKKGPTKEWAEGVSLAIGAFGEVYSLILKAGAINAIFGANIKPEDFGVAITTISQGIVDAAGFFQKNTAAFVGGPGKEWAEGVGRAIGAFAPVYMMLLENAPGFFKKGGGVGPNEFAAAIITVSNGIIAAAGVFADNNTKFEEGKYPSAKWGQGVGAALKAFTPIFNMMSKDSGWFTSGEEVVNNMIYAIKMVARTIVRVGKIFEWSKLKWTNFPESKWIGGISAVIKGYMNLVDEIGGFYDPVALSPDTSPVVLAARSMSAVARVFWKNGKFFTKGIPEDYMLPIMGNMVSFSFLSKTLRNSAVQNMSEDPVLNTAQSMSAMARVFYKNARFFRFKMVEDYMNPMKSNIVKFLWATNYIEKGGFADMLKENYTETFAKSFSRFAAILHKNRSVFTTSIPRDFMSKLSGNVSSYLGLVAKLNDENSLGKLTKNAIFGDPISNLASGMVKLASAYGKLATSLIKFNSAVRGIDDKKVKSFNSLNTKVLNAKGINKLSNVETSINASSIMANVLGSISLPNVQPKASKRQDTPTVVEKKGKHGTNMEQLDKMIDLLNQLVGNTSTLEEYIDEKMNAE